MKPPVAPDDELAAAPAPKHHDRAACPSPVVHAPAMSQQQMEVWRATMDLGDHLPVDAWTVVGGQMSHLHAWERDVQAPRPTSDIDTGLNVRAYPRIAVIATQQLADCGFVPVNDSPDGPQVQWRRGVLRIDVLVPADVARKKESRRKRDAANRVLLESHGIQQALDRSESVTLVLADGTGGVISRPRLVGSIVAKAAALSHAGDTTDRHLDDLAFMLPLLTAADVEREHFTARDRVHLTLAARHLSDERRRWASAEVIHALTLLDDAMP